MTYEIVISILAFGAAVGVVIAGLEVWRSRVYYMGGFRPSIRVEGPLDQCDLPFGGSELQHADVEVPPTSTVRIIVADADFDDYLSRDLGWKRADVKVIFSPLRVGPSVQILRKKLFEEIENRPFGQWRQRSAADELSTEHAKSKEHYERTVDDLEKRVRQMEEKLTKEWEESGEHRDGAIRSDYLH